MVPDEPPKPPEAPVRRDLFDAGLDGQRGPFCGCPEIGTMFRKRSSRSGQGFPEEGGIAGGDDRRERSGAEEREVLGNDGGQVAIVLREGRGGDGGQGAIVNQCRSTGPYGRGCDSS